MLLVVERNVAVFVVCCLFFSFILFLCGDNLLVALIPRGSFITLRRLVLFSCKPKELLPTKRVWNNDVLQQRSRHYTVLTTTTLPSKAESNKLRLRLNPCDLLTITFCSSSKNTAAKQCAIGWPSSWRSHG